MTTPSADSEFDLQTTLALGESRDITAVRAIKRIVYVDHTATLGGGEIALLNLVSSLDRQRYAASVVLLSDGPLAERLKLEDVEVVILPLSASVTQSKKDGLGLRTLVRFSAAFAMASCILRLALLLRKMDANIVHTNSLKADVVGGFAAKLARTQLVWHIRDRIDDDYLPRKVVRAFRFLSRMVPNFVIANSRATLHSLSRDGKLETLPKLNAVVHDGTLVDEAGSYRIRSNGTVRVGLVGRISSWKGQHIFIEAAKQVHDVFPAVKFEIIGAALFGETDYEARIRARVEELHLNDVVRFCGFRSDVRVAIAELNILVHASTTGEPFGQVIIEGMAAAKPVIATHGGGVPEIVEDGKTGLLVPMGDVPTLTAAILRLLQNPSEARRMGEMGYARVRDHFTIEKTARAVESVYDQLLSPA